MPTLPPSARHDLTDAEWALLAPLLPTPSGRGRPRTWGLRSLVNGIFFRIRTGCPWRDVHERYGPWWRIYDLFARLQADGVWEMIHTGLLSHAHHTGTLSWEVSVDSTTARVGAGRGCLFWRRRRARAHERLRSWLSVPVANVQSTYCLNTP